MIIGDRPSAKTVLQKLEQQKAEIERELSDRKQPLGMAKRVNLQRRLDEINKVIPPPFDVVMA